MEQNSFSLTAPAIEATWLPAPARLHAKRRRLFAWGLSCITHGLLIAVACWGGLRIVEAPPPTIRLPRVSLLWQNSPQQPWKNPRFPSGRGRKRLNVTKLLSRQKL